MNWVTLEENILRQRVTTDIATNGGAYVPLDADLPLERVEREERRVPAPRDLVARALDRVRARGVEEPRLAVRAGARLLDEGVREARQATHPGRLLGGAGMVLGDRAEAATSARRTQRCLARRHHISGVRDALGGRYAARAIRR